MTPEESELRVPRYFRREREKEIEGKRKFIEETLRSLGELEEKPEVKKMTEIEAIRLIQVRKLCFSYMVLHRVVALVVGHLRIHFVFQVESQLIN